MSSTLDACFKSAETAANVSLQAGSFQLQYINIYFSFQKDLESRTKELELEESTISEQRERLEAQRAIEFYDELGSELASSISICSLSSVPQSSSFFSSQRKLLP